MFYRIVVFHNLTKDTYYYKKLKGFYSDYYVGYINQFNHEVILIIDIFEILEKNKKLGRKPSLKTRFIDRLQSFLEKIK